MNTPVLLIHFNRPDVTRRQIECLASVRPSRVWVLCDGARANQAGEGEKVEEVRQLLANLPWPCELHTCFRDENLGVCQNISTGITWFLNEAKEGIILEDDCLPNHSFFDFSGELLERYRNEERVFAISGHSGFDASIELSESYAFSDYFACWGWATWQRAWQHYDPGMRGYSDSRAWSTLASRVFPQLRARLYWRYILSRVHRGQTDSWAYRFALSIWQQQGLGVFPARNLVENVGFNAEGTNTSSLSGMEVATRPLAFPLKHPDAIEPNLRVNRWLEDNYYSKSFSKRLSWLLNKLSRQ